MGENKHTPAPWHAIEFAGLWQIADEPFYEGNNLFDCEQCDKAKENAELAACAPELLEALQQTLNEYRTACKLLAEATGMVWSENHVSISAQKALDKATGK